MLDQVLELFDLASDYDLSIHQRGHTLAEITTRALEGLDRIVAERSPEVVVVQGTRQVHLLGHWPVSITECL